MQNKSPLRWRYAFGISAVYYAALAVAWAGYTRAYQHYLEHISTPQGGIESCASAIDELGTWYTYFLMLGIFGYPLALILTGIVYKVIH